MSRSDVFKRTLEAGTSAAPITEPAPAAGGTADGSGA